MQQLIIYFSLLIMLSHSEPVTAFAQTFSLDGEWQFLVDQDSTNLKIGALKISDISKRKDWRTARVPLSWQAQFADLRDYQGVAWYRRMFTVPQLSEDKTVLLKFGAVDYLAEVYVNGKLAGKHEGGYTPFTFDIGSFVKAGQNELAVRVTDPATTERGTEGISYRHIPHGKQSWYVQTSGIWQSVEFQIRPKLYIQRVHITPAMDGSFVFNVRLVGAELARDQELTVRVSDADGREVLFARTQVKMDQSEYELKARVTEPRYWSFTSPYLYTAEVGLRNGDTIRERFGFRSIEAHDKKLFLNGEPFYMIGALDQDFYPETIYTTPSEEYLRDEFLKAKKIGLNTLRCHIKVPDPRYLKVADEVGILLWYEIPNWDVLTSDAARRAEETFDAMLERDWNHPSLIIISLINESWGIDMSKAEQRKWLKEMFNKAKQKAIGRLIVDNSACSGNFHIKTDINDYHTYWSIPENRIRFNETVTAVAQRPKWLFSEHGDAEERGDEPLVMSEFGNWGLPKLPEKLPWWFERDFGGRKPTLPASVYERVQQYHLSKVFGGYNELAEETQKHQLVSLKYEIEQLRSHPEIQGYIITEFTDINWECNGLLDIWRNIKLLGDDIALVQQQDVIIPCPSKYNVRSGDSITIDLMISHYSSADVRLSTLELETETSGRNVIEVADIERASVKTLPPLCWSAPLVEQPKRVRFKLTLKGRSGEMLATNTCDILVYPKPRVNRSVTIGLHTPQDTSGRLIRVIKSAGYKIVESNQEASVVVATVLDEAVKSQLKAGKRVILLSHKAEAIPANSPLKLVSRESEWLDGNWATNFNWVNIKQPPFDALGFGKILGFESDGIAPKCVIQGIPAESYDDVLSGFFVAWVHLNSAYVVQMKVESDLQSDPGKLLICTFPLDEAYGSNEYATDLLDAVIDYVGGNKFMPKFEMKLE